MNEFLSKQDQEILNSLNLEESDLKALQEAVFHAQKLLESATKSLEAANLDANRRPKAIAILQSLRSEGIGEEAIKAALLAQFGRVKTKTGPKPPEEKPISQGLPEDGTKKEILEKIEAAKSNGLTIEDLYQLFPNIPQVSILSVVKNAVLVGSVIKYKHIIGRSLQDRYLSKKFIGGAR